MEFLSSFRIRKSSGRKIEKTVKSEIRVGKVEEKKTTRTTTRKNTLIV